MLTRPAMTAPATSPVASLNSNLAASLDGAALLAEQERLDTEERLPIASQEPTEAEAAHPLFGASLRDPQAIIETAQKQAAEARRESNTIAARSVGFRSQEEVEAEAKRAARRTRWLITAIATSVLTLALFTGAAWLGYGGAA